MAHAVQQQQVMYSYPKGPVPLIQCRKSHSAQLAHTYPEGPWLGIPRPTFLLCFYYSALPPHVPLMSSVISTGVIFFFFPHGLKNVLPSHRVIFQAAADALLHAVCKVTKSHRSLCSGLYLHRQNPRAALLLYRSSLSFHLQENCKVLQPAENTRREQGEQLQGGPLLLLVSWRQGNAQQDLCKHQEDTEGERSSPTGEKGKRLTQSLPKPNPTCHPSLMEHPSMLSLQHVLKTVWQLSTGSEEIKFWKFLPVLQKEIAQFHTAPKARE